MGQDPWGDHLAQRRLEVVDATALCDEPTPDRLWVIQDFIERQDRLFLAGPEGGGKSLMALTMSVQTAAGLPVLGKFELPDKLPAQVVYLDLESSRRTIQRRLRPLRISAKLPERAVHVVSVPDGLALSLKNVNDYIDMLAPYEPELLVIDPLYKLNYQVNLSDDRDVIPMLFALDRLRVGLNCAMLICHHFRKAGQGETRGGSQSALYGASALLRWPETIMHITEGRLEVMKDRQHNFTDERGEKAAWLLRWGGQWPIGVQEHPVAGSDDVLDVIKVYGPCYASKVADQVGGRRERVWKTIRRLEDAGLIVKQGRQWEAVR